jgi:hypothetical protein
MNNLEDVRSQMRRTAEDLMLARDFPGELERLSSDSTGLLAVVFVTRWIETPALYVATKIAHASYPVWNENLPYQPFCAWVLEICNCLPVASGKPVKKQRRKPAARKPVQKATPKPRKKTQEQHD